MKNFTSSLLFLSILLVSCDSNKKSDSQTDQKIIEESYEEEYDDIISNKTAEEPTFSLTGKKPSDFLPASKKYKIQYEAKGDLNGDKLLDYALVLQEKADKTTERPMLILLQNADKSYRLDKVSFTVFPSQLAEEEYDKYDQEDIRIEDRSLIINLYSAGFYGNLFSHFKYSGKDLILTYIETYNMGAGGHSSMEYDVEKGKLVQTEINMMEEDMPSKTTNHTLKKAQYFFESTEPDVVIQKAYEKISADI